MYVQYSIRIILITNIIVAFLSKVLNPLMILTFQYKLHAASSHSGTFKKAPPAEIFRGLLQRIFLESSYCSRTFQRAPPAEVFRELLQRNFLESSYSGFFKELLQRNFLESFYSKTFRELLQRNFLESSYARTF